MSDQPDRKNPMGAIPGDGSSMLPILSNPPRFWRSLEQLEGAGPPPDLLALEFPDPSIEVLDEPSRRDFLRFMGASLALGGMGGCVYQPTETIVPYVEAPENLVPGKPLFFASAVPIDGYACGVLVRSNMGRPTNVEGNPGHPASLGAIDIFAQATILTLYDPDRSQMVSHNARVDTWEHFQTVALDAPCAAPRQERSRPAHPHPDGGLADLSRPDEAPERAVPGRRWHTYEPSSLDNVWAGTRLAFGEDLAPIYRLDQADVIVSLDADFLARGPARLNMARGFAARREIGDARSAKVMNRLYCIEPTMSLTGASADHRLPVASRDVGALAQAIAGAAGVGGDHKLPDRLAGHEKWTAAVGRDLAAHRGKCLVIAGETQPPEVHALAHLINHALGNVGKTVDFIARVDSGHGDQIASLRELIRDIDAGSVDTLIIVGGNPVFDAPEDLGFAQAMAGDKVRLRIRLGLYDDETSQLCHWHIPEAHPLEAWSDLRAFDGTVSIQQPLIAPLYKGKSAHEVIAVFLGDPTPAGLAIIRDYWRRQNLGGDFEAAWRAALEAGLFMATASKPRTVAPKLTNVTVPAAPLAGGAENIEILFRPDPTIGDGRWANNGWLQELPKPLTKMSWDTAALLSPALARRLGISSEDVIDLRYQGRSLQIPAMIMPGQAENSITVFFGQGRKRAGRVGTNVGVDVYRLRTADQLWSGSGLEVATDERTHPDNGHA